MSSTRRRKDEMKFAYSGPHSSTKGLPRYLGRAFTKPSRDAAGHIVSTRYTASSPERYTIQSGLRPAVVDAIVAAFGRSAE